MIAKTIFLMTVMVLAVQSLDQRPCSISLPHEKDCCKYYRCINEELVLTDCPAGLHWNQATQKCDFPHLAGCCSPSGLPPSCSKNPTGRRSDSYFQTVVRSLMNFQSL